MAQIDWMVTGNRGSQFRIGLYHGDQSGHVLMYCNNRIIKIDFGVLSEKTYTLFLDDELCEISIQPGPTGYAYACSVNTDAATPLNDLRRARKKEEKRGMAIAIGVLIVVATSIGLFASMAHSDQYTDRRAEVVAGYGEITQASLYTSSGNGELYYNYTVDNRIYRGPVSAIPADRLPALPLAAGDRFPVRYHPERPRTAELLFDRFDQQQAERWRGRLYERYATVHPELSAAQVRCHLDAAQATGGNAAYLDLALEDEALAADNDHDPRYRDYWRLVRDPDFRRRVASCL